MEKGREEREGTRTSCILHYFRPCP